MDSIAFWWTIYTWIAGKTGKLKIMFKIKNKNNFKKCCARKHQHVCGMYVAKPFDKCFVGVIRNIVT